MAEMRHPNVMPLLAHSRAMAPMDADQGVTTYYMLFPLFKVTHALFLFPVWPGVSALSCTPACTAAAAASDMRRLCMHSGGAAIERSARETGCSRVQDGSLVDLLEELQKDKAHLPTHEVLSIFVQVLRTHISCTSCH